MKSKKLLLIDLIVWSLFLIVSIYNIFEPVNNSWIWLIMSILMLISLVNRIVNFKIEIQIEIKKIRNSLKLKSSHKYIKRK